MLVTLLVLWVVVIPALTIAGAYVVTRLRARRGMARQRVLGPAPSADERYSPRRLIM